MGTDKQFLDLCGKVDEIHEAVIRLETRFNGGPGTWPVCQQHSVTQQDHEKRIRGAERRINMVSGALLFIGLAATVATIYTAFFKHP